MKYSDPLVQAMADAMETEQRLRDELIAWARKGKHEDVLSAALSIADALGKCHRLYPALCSLADEIERLDADAANEKAEKESLAAIVKTRDAEIERLRAAMERYEDLERQARRWRQVVSPQAGHPKVLDLVAAIDRLPVEPTCTQGCHGAAEVRD